MSEFDTLSIELFPPEVCPICGYSLQGLPGEGICPECGNRYDSSQLILHGWACGQHANPTNTRGRRLLFAVLPSLWLLMQMIEPGATNRWRIIAASIWLISLVPAIMQRKSTDHPGGIQVRMNRTGIVQLDNLRWLRKKPTLANKGWTAWNRLNLTLCKPVGPDKFRIKLERRVAWYKLSTCPVDAEVQCSADQTVKLQGLIQKWHGGD